MYFYFLVGICNGSRGPNCSGYMKRGVFDEELSITIMANSLAAEWLPL
jgi:hypothetical protein